MENLTVILFRRIQFPSWKHVMADAILLVVALGYSNAAKVLNQFIK